MARQGFTLPLLRGTTTLESALEQEEDMLIDLGYPEQRIEFFVSLYSSRDDIENIASYHLGLCPSDTCPWKPRVLWGLSRIMLSLSRTPLPRIGSWTLDTNGILQLSNRPLTLRLHQLENAGIATNIGRSLTYSTADAYYLDLLSCHDSRIRYQPNSLSDADDGRAQMARLTIMQALLPHFANRELREGPFLYRLTDLHPSNIFVDNNWDIKFVVDLEWACSLPAETLRPPYWLTGRSIDDLTGEHLDTFRQAYEEFMDVCKEEEKSFPRITNTCLYRTELMGKGWQIGNFWYFQALDSPKGLFNLFHQHIHPIFASAHRVSSDFSRVVSDYWAANVEEVIAAKLRDKEDYDNKLSQRFKDAAAHI
ncbi:hypothetical protein AOCH_004573 [Aspergillus ochraceoroseus]|uniref:Aminoglycoside phosphotransferase domain-containing protein n=1 Tax=Aspergillus ochraceoroseus TaxID=138278 RepID=A0A0F8U9W8_9EURO|nr:hypothetical protein AOCH_004573 [Aspergillus ochraceoroseus]